MKSTLVVFLVLGWSGVARGAPDPHVATLVQVDGVVQIFMRPSEILPPGKTVDGTTLALFEGKYYQILNARPGQRIENGNVVRALPDARAKIIYDNGDQFYISPGTAYRVSWTVEGAPQTQVDLLYGKLRGVISKEGPRRKLLIKTRAATMGVRGTDFCVSDLGEGEEAGLLVLRGLVEVTSKSGEVTQVGTGMSAAVERRTEVYKTPKEELAAIQQIFETRAPAAPEFKNLEKRAVQVTLRDIETYQPEVLKKIPQAERRTMGVSDLNRAVLMLASESAPSHPDKKRKPNLKELREGDQEDVYQKYFSPGRK